MARSRNYQDFLLEQLQDHDFAVAYLNEALNESLKGDEESQKLFLIALRNVAEAQGGVGALKWTPLSRQKIHFTLRI
jgi:DNA-binding phage protein